VPVLLGAFGARDLAVRDVANEEMREGELAPTLDRRRPCRTDQVAVRQVDETAKDCPLV
jgi:hypothetical protein